MYMWLALSYFDIKQNKETTSDFVASLARGKGYSKVIYRRALLDTGAGSSLNDYVIGK